MSKTWTERLTEFRENIKKGYDSTKIANIISGHFYEVSERQRKILKYSGPMRAQMIREGERLHDTPTISSRNVSPMNAGFSVDLSNWAVDPDSFNGMDTFMEDIGAKLAEKEFYVIIKNLCDYAGTSIDSEGKTLTKNDLEKAVTYSRLHEIFFDTIVADSKTVEDFRLKSELWEPWNIPTGYIPESKRSPNFAGMVSGLRLYTKQFLENKIVIFRVHDVMTYTTPINVNFDTEIPSSLIVEKWCSSAPVIDQSVFLINVIQNK